MCKKINAYYIVGRVRETYHEIFQRRIPRSTIYGNTRVVICTVAFWSSSGVVVCYFVFHFIFVYWCDSGRASKMPVFHTKIIESILEPVAQQVSYFSILLIFCKFFSRRSFSSLSSSRPVTWSRTEISHVSIERHFRWRFSHSIRKIHASIVECHASGCAAYCAKWILRFAVVLWHFHSTYFSALEIFHFRTDVIVDLKRFIFLFNFYVSLLGNVCVTSYR